MIQILSNIAFIVMALVLIGVLWKLHRIHTDVNGKIETLLKVTAKAAKAEGVLEEKARDSG